MGRATTRRVLWRFIVLLRHHLVFRQPSRHKIASAPLPPIPTTTSYGLLLGDNRRCHYTTTTTTVFRKFSVLALVLILSALCALSPPWNAGTTDFRRHLLLHHPPFATNPSGFPSVCILVAGLNSLDEARQVYNLWGAVLPVVSYYYYDHHSQTSTSTTTLETLDDDGQKSIGIDDVLTSSTSSNVHVLRVPSPPSHPGGTPNTARARAHALNLSRSLHQCDYYLLQDGHINYTLHTPNMPGSNQNNNNNLVHQLLHILRIHNPLYLTFRRSNRLTFTPDQPSAFLFHETFRNSFFDQSEVPIANVELEDRQPRLIHSSIIDLFVPTVTAPDLPHAPEKHAANQQGPLIPITPSQLAYFRLLGGFMFDGICSHSITYEPIGDVVNATSVREEWVFNRDGVMLEYLPKRLPALDGQFAETAPVNLALTPIFTSIKTSLSLETLCKRLGPANSQAFRSCTPPHCFETNNMAALRIIQRINLYIDPRHSTIARSTFFQRPDVRINIGKVVAQTPVSLRITVMAFQQPAAVARLIGELLRQLKQENFHLAQSNIVVSVVLQVALSEHLTTDHLSSFNQTLARQLPGIVVEGEQYYERLKQKWLESWQPDHADSFHLVLDGDMNISTYLIRSSTQLIRSVFYSKAYIFDDVIGICLRNVLNSDVALRRPSAGTVQALRSSDSLRQSVCDGSAIYSAPGWVKFMSWQMQHGPSYDPVLKDALSNQWPVSQAWQKVLLRFLAENNMWTYHPRFSDGGSFLASTTQSRAWDCKLQAGCGPANVSVLEGVASRSVSVKNSVLDAPRFDYKLEPASADYGSFDGCTLVMPVCHRAKYLNKLLDHYTSVPFPVQVILVVQPCAEEQEAVSEIPERVRNVPIVVKHMSTNDMNNRYLDFPEIKYDCNVNIDDDVLHPVESMVSAIWLWRSQYFDHLVGWSPQVRIHLTDAESGGFVYKNQSWVRKYHGIGSMLLPSGTVYHRRFLSAYNGEANRPAREIVTREMNCDDILMNFVVANATGQGPVILDDWSSMERDGVWKAASNDLGNAQWKQLTHVIKREQCLLDFAQVYGGMPLKYTRTMFRHEPSIGDSEARLASDSDAMLAVYEYGFRSPSRRYMRYTSDLCDVPTQELTPYFHTMGCPRKNGHVKVDGGN